MTEPAQPPRGAAYKREPLYVEDGIPVFSRPDSYVDNYDRIAKDHIEKITSDEENPFIEEELWLGMEENTRAQITKYVQPGARILDVGVGLGRLLQPLDEYERYGVDISLDYLKLARERGIEVSLAKIEDMPFKDGHFDAIVTCDVLEHVLDLNLCCRRLIDCLRPGGTLIVRVPYKEDLDVYLRDDLPYELIHLRNFDEASLRLLFCKIFGLQWKVSKTSVPYLQGAPRLKLRLLPEEARQKALAILSKLPDLAPVLPAFQVSEETFVAWIYSLKATQPDLFVALAQELIHGIEIDCVFEKPMDHDIKTVPAAFGHIAAQMPQGGATAPLTVAQFDQSLRGLSASLIGLSRMVQRSDERVSKLAQSVAEFDRERVSKMAQSDERFSKLAESLAQSDERFSKLAESVADINRHVAEFARLLRRLRFWR